MVIQYQVHICDTCKSNAAPHAASDGQHVTASAVQRGEGPKLPADCGCALVLVGDCSICHRSAEQLGLAAKYHVQIDVKVTANETDETGTSPVSICGGCMLMLGQVVAQFSQNGQMAAIAQALAPKVIPAGTGRPSGGAQPYRHPLSVIPVGGFRRH